MRRLSQAGKIASHNRMFLQLGQRNQSADPQTAFTVFSDLVESANGFEVYYSRRSRDVVLHRRQEILAAGDLPRGIIGILRRWSRLEGADRFSNGVWTHPFKGFHALILSPIRPIRILSWVMGGSRTTT